MITPPDHSAAIRVISIAFITASSLFLMLELLSVPVPMGFQIGLFVIGSLVVGLPHGAMDYDVGRFLGLCKTLPKSLLFLSIYTLIAALNFALWIALPLIGFGFFLLLSLWHFGEDWDIRPNALLRRMAYGVGFLSIPTLLNSEELTSIFGFLVNQDDAALIISTLQIFAWPCIIAVLLFSIFDAIEKEWVRSTLGISFLLSGIFLPPILFLFLYFCTFHGPKHTAELYTTLRYKSLRHLIRRQTPVMVATVILVGLVFTFYQGESDLAQNLFSSLIIGIACLTTPHMLLIEYYNYRLHKIFSDS